MTSVKYFICIEVWAAAFTLFGYHMYSLNVMILEVPLQVGSYVVLCLLLFNVKCIALCMSTSVFASKC
jgi:hypothetical protein